MPLALAIASFHLFVLIALVLLGDKHRRFAMGFVPVNTTKSSTGFRFSRSASGGSRASNSEGIMSPNEEEGSLEGNRSGEMEIQEISGPILPPQSPKVSPQGDDSQQSSADESLEPPSASITIQLPEATNAEDYKLLPGHGIIRRVLRSEPDDSESTTYSILHRSGEVQVVSNGIQIRLHIESPLTYNFSFSALYRSVT